MKNIPAIFEQTEIRRAYDEKTETWWFAVVDIVMILTQHADYKTAKNYWYVLKHRLLKEGSQLLTDCKQLKLPAADGKNYLTDVANAETLLRLVQSIPSPKAEPIKLWLAKVGFERMQEMADPSLGLDRARASWQKHGRSEKWIQQRMTGQDTPLMHQETAADADQPSPGLWPTSRPGYFRAKTRAEPTHPHTRRTVGKRSVRILLQTP